MDHPLSSDVDKPTLDREILRTKLSRWRGYARETGTRFWFTLIMFGLLRLTHIAPLRVQLWFGRVIGRLTWLLAAKPRKIVRRNIQAYFSSLDKKQQRALEKESFASLGMTVVEVPYFWWAPLKKLERRCTIEGLEHLEAARRQGTGVIFLGFHLATVESVGVVLCHNFRDLVVVYRPYRKNPLADELTRNARGRLAKELIDRADMKKVVRRLRQNEVVFFAGDLIVRPGKRSEVLPFFGVPTLFHSGTIDLARLTGAKIVPYFPQRLPGARYKIDILPALEGIPSDDRRADMMRINAALEEVLVRDPSQYLWTRDRLA